MKTSTLQRFVACGMTAFWLLIAFGPAHAADVSVNINLPAPVIALPAPPHMVWLPGPRIYIAFESPHHIFFHNDNYYLYDQDVWYVGQGYGGPWVRTQVKHLPPGLHKYRREQWHEYQRQAQSRYRNDDDHQHRNFVGWKDKKERKEKYGKGNNNRDKDKGRGPKHKDR
jgi:hypothetical protein